MTVVPATQEAEVEGSLEPRSSRHVARTTGMCHHAWLIFVFLIEMGSSSVTQAGGQMFIF